VESALRQAGVSFDAVATRAPLDAMAIAERAAGNYTAVIGVGGDGTLHEIVNGLLRASGEAETTAVGMVPLGNGDDFAKVILQRRRWAASPSTGALLWIKLRAGRRSPLMWGAS